jgi:hypothetical protein
MAEDARVVVEDGAEPLLQALKEPGRSIDVGEQKGDGSGRQTSHLALLMES